MRISKQPFPADAALLGTALAGSTTPRQRRDLSHRIRRREVPVRSFQALFSAILFIIVAASQPARAQTCPPVPYTLTNGTSADASQVMANFNNIVNCLNNRTPLVFPPGGRLTLTSGTPVVPAGVSAATTIFYTPYSGNLIPINDGTTFVVNAFAELSNVLAQSSTGNAGPAVAVASSNYDLFVWSNGGTLTLTRGPAWSNGSTRAMALSRQSGLLVNAAAITNGPAANRGTYVGTIRTDAAGGTVSYTFGGASIGGTAANLGVWNMFNRAEVAGLVQDTTVSWTYTATAWRQANNSAGNRVNFVVGMMEDRVSASYTVVMHNSGASAGTGIGVNSISAFSGTTGFNGGSSPTSTAAAWAGFSPLGANYISAIEYAFTSGSTATYYGTSGVPSAFQGGLLVSLRM